MLFVIIELIMCKCLKLFIEVYMYTDKELNEGYKESSKRVSFLEVNIDNYATIN